MAIFNSTDGLPNFNKAVLTIGTFDGVHLGHRTILEEVVKHATETGGESILITFEPHPRKLLFPDKPIEILTPLNEKLEQITAIGIQHVVVVPFTHEFASQSAAEYVRDFLVAKFHPASIVIGYDHHFGADRKGNIQLLNELKDEYGFEVVEINAQLIENAAVSSTKIRNAVKSGDVAFAANMLNRHYSLKGTVIEGAKLGNTIGYPTANIKPLNAEQIIPGKGVYAVKVNVEGQTHTGMLNIGVKPTVSEGNALSIEVNIFDFSENIYGKEIEVSFVARIRDEQMFEGVDALKQQLGKDKADALIILA
ncbi:MAG: bifunctional riboflavin kinase/FAD synthetase [Chitinophagales bacterium]|nr:bifunctional riboflavin kinase/FAD synthetase [Chitinophagaceae bacterium]MCB9064875.1 bifunctional riboflavin kinase/FAD synthetase [Chitinophagales bacterium]